MCCDTNLANTISIEDVVKGILQREGDTTGMNYLKYLSVAKDVYRELNLHAVRQTKRAWVEVDKKTNTIKLPKDYMFFSSVSVEDECGRLIPLVINNNLKYDIIDISQDKDCHCECGCNSASCGGIKNYEVISGMQVAKLPDGSDMAFATMTRKKVNKDGSMVVEKTFPKAIYENGVWTKTELVTEEEFICKLEVKDCGCVKENEKNNQVINACCGASFFSVECGGTSCKTSPQSLTYNVSEGGDRIIFPSSFHYAKVLLRYFYDAPLKELRVPIIAKRAMMFGVKFEISNFDKKESMNRIMNFKRNYTNEMTKVRGLLNRYNLKGFYDYVLGQKQMM